MNASVLIPVKSLNNVKTRLSDILSDSQRQTLMTLLFRHVVTTIQKSRNDLQIYVVSNDPTIINEAATLAIHHVEEKHIGHNTALTEAAKQVNPNIPLLTISADIPFVTEDAIDEAISFIGDTDAVIIPSKEKTGTNALVLKKPLLIPYLFGANSFSKFADTLEKKHERYKIYRNDSLAFDIDTVQDFKYFTTQLQKNRSVLHNFYKKIVY